MKIEWFGHACFGITNLEGLKIITDPYESGLHGIINYGAIDESADIVTVSHEHGDHNYLPALIGNPAVVRGTGTIQARGMEFRGIEAYHHEERGAKSGPNTVFTFVVDGVRVAHLGDLGHTLSSEQLGELKDTDVLLAPTGGPPASLELEEMIELWEKLRPKIVIPMHFRSDKCSFPKYDIHDLIRLRPGAKKIGASFIDISSNDLPDPIQITILDPSR
jgi:L-ascorbate metabolism protein UlaG (beta-lactamase superfamily)